MKKASILLVALGILLILGGCGKKDSLDIPDLSSVTAAAEEENQGTETTEYMRDHEPLGKKELDEINNLFTEDCSPYSQALTSYFERPEDVDLHQLFYNGPLADRNTENSVATDVEISYLEEQFGADDPRLEMDVTAICTDEMDRDLKSVFQITLDQSNKVGLDDFTYVPDSGRYFLFHGDTNAQCINLTDGIWLDEDTAELHYLGFMDVPSQVIMNHIDGKWYIVSNSKTNS